MDTIGYIFYLGHKIPYGPLLEEWRDVVGYEGYYLVSNYGRIKTCEKVVFNQRYNITRTEKIKGVNKTHQGYIKVCFQVDKKSKNFFVHRLVATAFIPNPENKKCVNHIRGIKGFNLVTQICWATNKENSRHAFDTGLSFVKKGNRKNCKLSKEDVYEIRELLKQGKTQVEISSMYDKISRGTISNIKIGKSYSHL